MPLAKGSKNGTIRVGLLPKLEKKHKEQLLIRPTTEKTLIGYVNELIASVLKKDEFLKIYFPGISAIGILDNKLYLRDKELDKSICVFPRNGKLYCDTDHTFECKHINYIFALPEIAYLKLGSENQNKSDNAIRDENMGHKLSYKAPPDVIKELKELFPEITDNELIRLGNDRAFIEGFFLGINSYKKACDKIRES